MKSFFLLIFMFSFVLIRAENLPKVTIETNKDSKYPAYFVMMPYDQSNTFTASAMIFDKSANLFKTFTGTKPFFDFKPTSNGLFSYFDILRNAGGYGEANVLIIDTSGNKIATLGTNNEYFADFHDFKYLPNGNKLFIAYAPNYLDLSKVVADGNPNSNYPDGIIQEVDGNGKTVFQWRSGHKIDVTESYNPLNQATNSYIHINSLDLDLDGNIIISCRNISQILKINRKTGEIMWRMGGKKNEFTFLNDHEENKQNYFSFTHSVRVLPNGNFIIFDNGNQKLPVPYSRALEYEVDQVKKTAKLVWEFRHTPDIYTPNQGSIQRLKNGNTLIGWGGATTSPGGTNIAATEVTPNGEVVFEVSIPGGVGISSYRVLKTDELTCPPAVTIQRTELAKGNTFEFVDSAKNKYTGIKLTVNELTAFTYNKLNVNKFDCNTTFPSFDGVAPKIYNYRIQTTALSIDVFNADMTLYLVHFPEVINKNLAKIYFRKSSGGQFKEIATTYDQSKNALLFTIDGFGDLLIGEPTIITNKPSKPFLQTPENQATLRVLPTNKFRWQTDGYASKHNIQISLDSTFNTVNYEMKDSNQSVINIPISKVSNQTAFIGYWRVASGNDNGYSDWSNKSVFYYGASPIIAITNVNTGDTINKKSRKILRWNTNIDDSLKLTLLKNNIEILTIKKSLYSVTNAIDWTVPDTLANSSDYSFKLISLNPANPISTESKKFIIGTPTSVDDNSNISKIEFYPNPVINNLTITNLELSNKAQFVIRDLNGKVVKTFENVLNIDNNISLDCSNILSGVYFLEIIDLNKKYGFEFIKN